MTLNSTEKYIQENKQLNGLKRIILNSESKINYDHDNIIFFIKTKIKLFKEYIKYIKEKKQFKTWIDELEVLRHSQTNKQAIVLGNGPSQGYLTEEILNNFKRKGGEIFVVNFWTQNKKFSSVIPNYIVISDPITLSNQTSAFDDKNKLLKSFVINNPEIKIVCPTYRCEDLANTYGKNRIIGFVDNELRGITNNIEPNKPRGYVSMTLYKALAIALWFNYKNIYILGMDNTYPRNTFCDKDNKILNLEIHAGGDNFVTDHTERYSCMGDLMIDLSHLYYDARKFYSGNKIINLDPYSLTDAFPKADGTSLDFLL